MGGNGMLVNVTLRISTLSSDGLQTKTLRHNRLAPRLPLRHASCGAGTSPRIARGATRFGAWPCGASPPVCQGPQAAAASAPTAEACRWLLTVCIAVLHCAQAARWVARLHARAHRTPVASLPSRHVSRLCVCIMPSSLNKPVLSPSRAAQGGGDADVAPAAPSISTWIGPQDAQLCPARAPL
jgi:hypothetical protein